MKSKILELRNNGFSYNKIVEILGCSKSTVSYHCGLDQKYKNYERNKINRAKAHPYLSKIYCFTEKSKLISKKNIKSSLRKQLMEKTRCFQKGSNKTFTLDDVIEKFGENPKCYLTGRPIDIYKPSTYHFDHIIPRSKGGNNSIDNLGICVSEVNFAKGGMTNEEFISLCREVVNKAEGVGDDPTVPLS